jgi:hypothetical protein
MSEILDQNRVHGELDGPFFMLWHARTFTFPNASSMVVTVCPACIDVMLLSTTARHAD